MSHKPVIPTPPALRWREFRIQVIPAIIFGLVLLASVMIWKNYVFPSSLVGRVEAIQADVTTPQAGYVSQLFVSRFQKVLRGDPIAEVTTIRPEVMSNTLAVIRAEIELLRVGMDPVLSAQRILVDRDRLQLDLMRQRVELAMAKENLKLAVADLQRMSQLHQDKLIMDFEYDAARSKKNALQAQVEELTRLVETLGKEVQGGIWNTWTNGLPDARSQLQAAIAVQDHKLKLAEAEMQPALLRAPIDGMVNAVRLWPGETVPAGQPVVTVSAFKSERVIGYMRQPLYLEPKTGMVVQVRTRGYQRVSGQGQILAVGGQLQPINDTLLPPTKYNTAEHGLAILVSLPENIKCRVHPGEFVDMTIVSNP